MKTVTTIINDCAELIYLGEIFKKLDANFNHVLINAGLHYDEASSGSYFENLKLRRPDHNTHDPETLKEIFNKINPDIILFSGATDATTLAPLLRKEGYIIGHMEAGVRSGNRRLAEEINRIICDHCSDYHFVCHKDHGLNLLKENLPKENIFVVGCSALEQNKNAYAEATKNSTPIWYKKHIILNITSPENLRDKERLNNILTYAYYCGQQFQAPVRFLNSPEALARIDELDLSLLSVEVLDSISYKSHIRALAQSIFIISDSDDALYQAATHGTPITIPKDDVSFPQSVKHSCSFMVDVNSIVNSNWRKSLDWVEATSPDSGWLGDGKTSQNMVDSLKIIFNSF